jgi:hypothetical protein
MAAPERGICSLLLLEGETEVGRYLISQAICYGNRTLGIGVEGYVSLQTTNTRRNAIHIRHVRLSLARSSGSKAPKGYQSNLRLANMSSKLNDAMKNLKTFLSVAQLSDLKNTFHDMFCVKAGRGLIN